MGGNRVIESVLRLKDEMSKGLLGVAKNAKKAGAQINNEMLGSTRKVSAWGKNVTKSIDSVVGKLGKLTLAAGAAFAVFSLKTGMDFEAGLSKVKATGQLTAEQMERIEGKAREVASSTKFTLAETADALNYMAMAGWDDQKMLAGLPHVVNLSIATDTDIGTTSDIVTDAMTALKMVPEGFTKVLDDGILKSVSNVQHFSDVIAAASSNSNTNTTLLGESFKQAGTLAGAFGYTIDDVGVALGLMANVGVKGSTAGMALKNAFNNMLAPTDKAAALMERYGVSMQNSDGSAKTLLGLMQNLRSSFGGLDVSLTDVNGNVMEGEELLDSLGNTAGVSAEQMEKIRAVSEIFSVRALPGLLGIIQASETDWNKLTSVMKNCNGAAETMAKTMSDNLTGDLQKLQSAVGDVGWEFYKAISGQAREAVQALTAQIATWSQDGTIQRWAQNVGNVVSRAMELAGNAIQWYKEHSEGLKRTLKLLAGAFVVSKVAGFVSKIGEAVTTVSTFAAMLGQLAAFHGLAHIGAAFGGLSSVLGMIGSPFTSLLQTLQKLPSLLTALPGKFMALVISIGEGFAGLVVQILKHMQGIPGSIVGFFKGIPGRVIGVFSGLAGGVKGAFLGVLSFFTGLPGMLVSFFKGIPGALIGAFKAIPGLLKSIFANPANWGFAGFIAIVAGVVAAGVLLYRNWDIVKAKASELWGQLKSNLAPAFETVKSVASQVAQFFTGTVVPAASALWAKVKEVAIAFVTAMAPAASIVLGVVSQLATFFVNTVVPAIVSIVQFIGQLASAFLTVATPAIQAVTSIIGVLANVFTTVVAPAIGVVATVITGLANIFISKVVPHTTAVLNTARTLANFFTGVLKAAIETVQSVAQSLASFLTGVFGPAFATARSFAQQLANFFSGVLTGAIGAVRSAFYSVRDAVSGVISKIQTFLGMNTTKTVTVNTIYKSSGQSTAGSGTGKSLGSPYWRGGMVEINERGGEVLQFPNGKQLIPQDVQKIRGLSQRLYHSPGWIDKDDKTQIRDIRPIQHLGTLPAVQSMLAGKRTIVNLPSGTKIIPHDKSVKLLKEAVSNPLGALGAAGLIGHNAMGTPYWRGGLTEINERRGEIIQLPGQKTIVPESLISQITSNLSSSCSNVYERVSTHVSTVSSRETSRETDRRRGDIHINMPITVNGNLDDKTGKKMLSEIDRHLKTILENYA